MKYDCTKTEDFVHEIGRMFVETNRYGSKIEDLKYRVVDSNGEIHNATRIQENIKWVQAWSDAHPERTNADVFMERYPNAALTTYGIPLVNPCYIDKKYEAEKCSGHETCDVCKEAYSYWNAPYEGVVAENATTTTVAENATVEQVNEYEKILGCCDSELSG